MISRIAHELSDLCGMQSAMRLTHGSIYRQCFMQGCAMPVAISFSNTANSAAQFIDGAVSGDVVSGASSNAADVNRSAASLLSKDRESSDDDFNAVLAMLLNGGVPPLQTPVIPLSIEANVPAAGTVDATTDFAELNPNAAAESSFVNIGQMLLQGRNSSTQAINTNLGVARTSESLFDSSATTEATHSADPTDMKSASSAAANASAAAALDSLANSQQASMATTQTEQGGASLQISGDVTGLPIQELPISGAATEADVATTAINLTVEAQSSESVIVKPMSNEVMQALERIGRPAAPEVDTQNSQQATMPLARSAVSGADVSDVAPQLTVGLAGGLNLTAAVAESATAPQVPQVPQVESDDAAGEPLPLTSELNTRIGSLSNTTSKSAETTNQSASSISAESEAAFAKSIEASASASDSAPGSLTSNADLMSPGSLPHQFKAGSEAGDASSDADSVRLDKPKSAMVSPSDATTATMQSGLVSSASPNAVPDLAASISAEIRQPLTSQVSQAIMDHVERNGVRQNDSLSVRLDPPELGEMTIQLSKTHEGLAVRVTAREAVTMDMLFARGQEIESQLRSQHMNLKSLEFQRTDMSSSGFSHGQGQPQQQNNSSRRSENLMNQIRSGARGVSLLNPGIRSATPDSSYGLSFRA